MPTSYEIDAARSLIRCRTWGSLTNAELCSRIFAAYAETGLQEVKVFRDMAAAARWLDLEVSA